MIGRHRRRRAATTSRRRCCSPGARPFVIGCCRGGEAIGFALAMIVPDEAPAVGRTAAGGRMEIVTAGGRRIIVGADVDARALARVVAVLEGR